MTVSLVDQLTPELLWAHVQSLLPLEPSNHRGGRPRIPARQVLAGIVFVLRHGLPWRSLPQQLGFGSGLTCRRTMVEWTEAGLWEKVHHLLLEHLQREDLLDWSRASADSASIAAPKGGADRTEPDRSWKERDQDSSGGGCLGHSPGADVVWRKCSRFQRAGRVHSCHSLGVRRAIRVRATHAGQTARG